MARGLTAVTIETRLEALRIRPRACRSSGRQQFTLGKRHQMRRVDDIVFGGLQRGAALGGLGLGGEQVFEAFHQRTRLGGPGFEDRRLRFGLDRLDGGQPHHAGRFPDDDGDDGQNADAPARSARRSPASRRG
jgi:hypothetical protein